MASGNHAVRRGFNTKYAAFTGAFPFIGDVSRRCCPEGAISAAVALVVDGVFVGFLLGIALRLQVRCSGSVVCFPRC